MRTYNAAAIILAIQIIFAHQWSLVQIRIINRLVEQMLKFFNF